MDNVFKNVHDTPYFFSRSPSHNTRNSQNICSQYLLIQLRRLREQTVHISIFKEGNLDLL